MSTPERDPPEEATELDIDLERRKVAYHEAAHAVLFWNLGFGVSGITVNRKQLSGHVQTLRHSKNRSECVGRAIGGVAGLASQALLGQVTWEDVSRSQVDLRRAYSYYSRRDGLTHGEQLGIGIELSKRVVTLLQEAAIRKQIESLTKPLLRDGRMFQAQIHARLEQHPATPAAKRRCREFVDQIASQHDEIVKSVTGYAPEFRWPAELR